MTPHLSRHNGRPLAARLLLTASIIISMLAGPFAAAPASAGSPDGASLSPNKPLPVVEATTCSAVQSGFSAATGSCQNPSSAVTFRVNATCRHAPTGALYQVQSPVVSSFNTTHAFCDFLWPDPIINWSVTVFLPPKPVISSLNCQVSGWTQLSCNTSASGWTQLRWFVDNSPRLAWNNQTSVQGGCPGFESEPNLEIEIRDVIIKVNATNAGGTTTKTTVVTCVVKSS
jgi:hypothetical protein